MKSHDDWLPQKLVGFTPVCSFKKENEMEHVETNFKRLSFLSKFQDVMSYIIQS